MKIAFIWIILLSSSRLLGQSQDETIFFESFEQDQPFTIHAYNNTAEQVEVVPRENAEEKCLKMTIEDHNKTGPKSNGRVEIRRKLSHGEKTTRFYSWKMLIPDDGSFVDNASVKSPYHIIAQFHQGNTKKSACENDQPVMKLSYIHEENETDKKRDLRIEYGYYKKAGNQWPSCDGSTVNGKKALRISDAITKGEWFTITFEMFWDVTSAGYLKVYIDGALKGELTARNIHYDNRGEIMNNALKLGHYRSPNHTGTHTLYIDDIRFSNHRIND